MLTNEVSLSDCHLSEKSRTTIISYFHHGFSTTNDNGKLHRIIYPQKVALRYQGMTHSFEQLDQISDRIASFFKNKFQLENQTTNENLIVAICLSPSDKLIVVLFAILKLGVAYLPLDPLSPSDRLEYIVSVAKPLFLVTEESLDLMQKIGKIYTGPLVTVKEIWNEFQKFGSENLFKNSKKEETENIAVVMFTSGSTGEPKGVRLSHGILMNRFQWQWTTFPYKNFENCCFKTALTFVDSIAEIFCPLLTGQTLTIFPRREVTQPHIFAQRILENQITQLLLVPSLLRALLTTVEIVEKRHRNHHGEFLRPLNSVKVWISSGEPLSPDLALQYFTKVQNEGVTLCNLYGMTEVTDVLYHVFNPVCDLDSPGLLDDQDDLHVEVPIGQPVQNWVTYILNENLQLVEDGQVGEICVTGPLITNGYLGGQGQCEQNEKYLCLPQHLAQGSGKTEDTQSILYRTGDFGFIRKMRNGQRGIFYLGRSDTQVKVRGHRVDLNEIQEIIKKLNLVQDCILLCHHREESDQQIVAFIIPQTQEETRFDEELTNFGKNLKDEISQILKTKLLEYQIPILSIISKIPQLVNGKTDRQKLLDDFDRQMMNQTDALDDLGDDTNHHHENLNLSLKTLLKSISKFTGNSVQNIKLDDSFYEIGGTSLNSIAVISHLKTMNFEIAIEDFVAAKTIQELAQHMRPVPGAKTSDTDHVTDLLRGDQVDEDEWCFEILNDDHRAEAIEIIAYGFMNKADMIFFTDYSYQDLEDYVLALWPSLLGTDYSFVARRHHDDKMVAVSLNFDYHNPPPVLSSERILNDRVEQFMKDIGKPYRNSLPPGTNILHCFAVATHKDCTAGENVKLTLGMEKENLRVAQSRHFQGIMTENTSPLTQQLCRDVLGHQEVCRVQINQYEAADGSKPFIFAPDDQVVTISAVYF